MPAPSIGLLLNKRDLNPGDRPRRDAERFSAEVSGGSGTRIFFKREDLAHTGAHKINNALGQALPVFPSPLLSKSSAIPGSDEKSVDLPTVFEVLEGENSHGWVAVDPVVTQELTALQSAPISRECSRRIDMEN